MASTLQLAFLAVAVLLLQAPWCAVSQQDATMVWTSFDEGPAACDGRYYNNYDRAAIAALSTEWYVDGARCFRGIDITRKDTGKTVRAYIVDEVDGDNMVATSGYIWISLGFDANDFGEVAVTWVDAKE